jgi:hypothetical protein
MRRFCVALGLLLVLAGCTSDPPPPSPTAVPKPAPHPAAPRAQDRDEKAVLDTLASLDPCALADKPAGGRSYLRQPHLCILDTKDYTGINVKAVERTTHSARYLLPSKQIGGAKVDTIKKSDHGCSMEIPVSFRYAVEVLVLPRKSVAECDVMDGVAATVIKRLGNANKVRHPADRADLSKVSCEVLLGALADVGKDPQEKNDTNDLDRCYLKGGMWLEQLVEPGPPDGGWGKPWTKVAGKQIYVSKDDECQWTWNEGPYSGADDRLIVLRQDSCHTGDVPADETKVLVNAVITGLEKPQQPVGISKLTYGPDEADEPNPGACADYAVDDCEPYQPTPVPAGAGPASLMARADQHVLCAATIDAVHAQLPALRPVVSGPAKACVFVEPDHAVELVFTVTSAGGLVSGSGVTDINIKGRTGAYGEDTDPATATLCVDAWRDEQRRDDLSWCVTATFRSGKANGSILEPLMTAVVTKNLT